MQQQRVWAEISGFIFVCVLEGLFTSAQFVALEGSRLGLQVIIASIAKKDQLVL